MMMMMEWSLVRCDGLEGRLSEETAGVSNAMVAGRGSAFGEPPDAALGSRRASRAAARSRGDLGDGPARPSPSPELDESALFR